MLTSDASMIGIHDCDFGKFHAPKVEDEGKQHVEQHDVRVKQVLNHAMEIQVEHHRAVNVQMKDEVQMNDEVTNMPVQSWSSCIRAPVVNCSCALVRLAEGLKYIGCFGSSCRTP